MTDTAPEISRPLPQRVAGDFTARTEIRGCMVTGCQLETHAMVVCVPHWRLLPARLRDAVWNEYQASWATPAHPSNGYKAALRAAVEWLEENTEFRE